MKDYLLSVVIPTRNRAKYANLAIRQALSIGNADVQIVVQDNSDNDELRILLTDVIDNNNLVYNYTNDVLSFVDNFDLAISLSTGRFVTIIGDDDGITTGLYKAAKWAEDNNYKAVKPNLHIVYFWPGSLVFGEGKDNGILKIVESSGIVKKADPKSELSKLLSNSCQNYLDMDLVKIYHGIVSRDLLDNVKKKTGKYVAGLSPDIYLSVALTSVLTEKIIAIDVPLTISGICKTSGSSASATGAHTGELKDAPHFVGHEKYEWKKEVPKFYSVETIWADSALAAIYDLNPSLVTEYDSTKLTIIALKKYKKFSEIIRENYAQNGGNNSKMTAWEIKKFINRCLPAIKHRLTKEKQTQWENIADIQSASEIAEEQLHKLYKDFFEN